MSPFSVRFYYAANQEEKHMSLAVIGISEVPTLRDPDRKRWDILLDICKDAVRDAGIDKNDVHAVISPNPMAQPDLANDMALGKCPRSWA